MIAEEGDLANIFVCDYCNNMNKTLLILITTQTGRILVARYKARHRARLRTQTKKHNSQQNATEHPQNQFIVFVSVERVTQEKL